MFIAMGAAAATLLLQGFGGQAAPVPRGSYIQSCSGAYVNQGRLYASCRDRQGRLSGTSIPLGACANAEIVNNNGLLQCGGFRGEYEGQGQGRPGFPGQGQTQGQFPGQGRPGFPGQGQSQGQGGPGARGSVVVYEDIDYRGRAVTLSGQIDDLSRTPFNDRISSFRLQGAWEMCTDAFFRGRCQVFVRDERNLVDLRLNDQISSLRPVNR